MLNVIGAECETCGTEIEVTGPRATGDAYLDARTGKIRANCLNAQICAENRARRAQEQRG